MRHQTASRIAVMVLLLIPYLPVILLLLPPIAAHFDAIIRSVDPGYRGFRADPEDGLILAAVYVGLVTLYLAPVLIAYLRTLAPQPGPDLHRECRARLHRHRMDRGARVVFLEPRGAGQPTRL